MAKHCNVCKQSYSDDLSHCPHCAGAAHEHPESKADPGLPAAGPGTHAEVDLGRSRSAGRSEPVSGESSVVWSSLVDKGDEAPLKIDSPSDADLLRFARSGEAMPDAAGARPAEGGSAVNLGGSPSGVLASGSGEMPPPSGLGLVSDAIEEEAFSGVLMRGGPDDPASMRPIPPTGLEHRHTPPPLPLPSESDFAPEDADLSNLEGSSVDLGTLATTGERPSGRDLIAEAVESGVDLHKDQPPADKPKEREADRSRKAALGDSDVDLAALGPVVDSPSDPFASRAGRVATDLHLASLAEESADQAAFSEPGGAPPAAAEYESTAAEDEVPRTPPSRSPPESSTSKHRSATQWVAGGAVGVLAGAGVCLLLWVLGIEPPDALRLSSPSASPTKKNPANPPQGTSVSTPTLASVLADVRNGDLDKAMPVLEAAGDEPERLAARGEVRWLTYLKQQREKNAPPSANDAAVKLAMDDLAKANTPHALFWLGNIEEQLGNLDKARERYQKAMTDFPQEKRLFQAALDRLDSAEADQSGASLPSVNDAHARARDLALVLTALQGETPPAPAEGDEAGALFWNAAKLAKEGKYPEAIKALDQARELHDKKRFSRIHKAQNPTSDPNEEIFLRCCAELKTYWQLRDMLNDGGYPIGPKQTVSAALEAALKDAKGGAGREVLQKKYDQVAKDLDAEKKKSAGHAEAAKQAELKARDEIAKAKDDAAKAAKEWGDKLKAAEEQAKTAQTTLKAVSARLEAAGIKTVDVAKGVDELAAARTDANSGMNEIAKKLEDGTFISPKASAADILKGVDRVVTLAKTSDPQGQLSSAKQDLQKALDALAQRRTPREMLPIWLPLLSNRGQNDGADKALADAERVLKDEKETVAVRAEALALKGLALRNQGKYSEAKPSLEQALKEGAAAKQSAWYLAAQTATKELSDPAAFYLPRAAQLSMAGRYPAALKLLDESLKVFPKDEGRLLAERAVVRLDQARIKNNGKLASNDPAVAEIRKDAEAAIAGAPAEGHYASGRLAEALGQLEDARRHFQQALDAKTDNHYRLALGRVLLKLHPEKPAASSGREGPTEVGSPRVAFRAPPGAPGILTDGGPGAGRGEVDRLADEILATAKDDPEGLVLKAQALALKGLWTKALTTYINGLRPRLSPDDVDNLLDIIDKHPALKRPDTLQTTNFVAADRHYTAGLQLYSDGKYSDAEKEFLSAVENDSQDARYYYYLGLSRLLLNKRDAALADFEQGAKLELQGRPDRATVSDALERVQGLPRQEMNRVRP